MWIAYCTCGKRSPDMGFTQPPFWASLLIMMPDAWLSQYLNITIISWIPWPILPHHRPEFLSSLFRGPRKVSVWRKFSFPIARVHTNRERHYVAAESQLRKPFRCVIIRVFRLRCIFVVKFLADIYSEQGHKTTSVTWTCGWNSGSGTGCLFR